MRDYTKPEIIEYAKPRVWIIYSSQDGSPDRWVDIEDWEVIGFDRE